MTGPAPMCMFCRHYIGAKMFGGWECDAFPDGIPDSIASGILKHYDPVSGDNGIQFEQKPTGPRFSTAPRVEARHYGPGKHKSGSTQKVHGHGGTRDRDRAPIYLALTEGEVTDVQPFGQPLGVPSANQRFIWKGKAGGVPVIIKTAGVDKELATQVANELAGGLVSLPVMVQRSAPHGSRAIYMETLPGDPAMRLPYHSTTEDKAKFFGAVLDETGRAELHDMDVFDSLIGNYDRSRGNMLIDKERIHAIDHGRAWSEYDALPWWEGQPLGGYGYHAIFSGKPEIEPRHQAALNLWKDNLRNGGRERLQSHTSPKSVDLAVQRANWMLQQGRIWRNDPLDGIEVDV